MALPGQRAPLRPHPNASVEAELKLLDISVKPQGDLSPEDKSIQQEARDATKKLNLLKWEKSAMQLVPHEISSGPRRSGGLANFFKVTKIDTTVDLRRYRVEFAELNGKVPTKREVRKAFMGMMILDNPPDVSPDFWVSDDHTYIISVGRLYNSCGDVVGSVHSVPHRIRASDRAGQSLIQTTIVYEGKVRLGDLQSQVTSKLPNANVDYLPGEDLKSLNIVSWFHLRKVASNFQGGIVGKKFYPNVLQTRDEKDRNGNFTPKGANSGNITSKDQEIYRLRTGFFTSMRPGDGSLLLNVNTTTSAFYAPLNLQRWLDASDLRPRQMIQLKALRVTFSGDLGQVRAGEHRVVCEVLDTPFKHRSYSDRTKATARFKQDYPGVHFDDNAKSVNIGGKTPWEKWVPADTLTIVEWQVFRGKLDSNGTRAMLAVAEKSPAVNQALISTDALRQLKLNQKIEGFGIAISSSFLPFRHRMCAFPALEYRNVKVNPKPTWDMKAVCRSKDVRKSGGSGFHHVDPDFHQLFIFRFAGNPKGNLVDKFLDYFRPDLYRYGFTIDQVLNESVNASTNVDAQIRRAETVVVFNAAYDRLQRQNGGKKLKLLLAFLPSKDASIYADFKWWADCIKGVSTVCISPDALQKAVDTQPSKGKPLATTEDGKVLDLKLLGNLALKINFKLRGTNHKLSALTELKGNTMIIGADVTHSGRGVDPGCPSLAGVVASYQEPFTFYAAAARLQSNNTEHINDLGDMISQHLITYWESNGKHFPDHILLYRDGVSESQYGMVKDEELKKIQDACKEMIANAQGRKENKVPATHSINITLIVVGKRHHTRFFPNQTNNSSNYPAGMCVDQDVVVGHQYSFYLQSHVSPLGTAKSGHYVVIQNDSGYRAKELQDLTNRLCYLGQRATTALSICTPARYADILCERLRCYIRPVTEGEMVEHLKNNAPQDYRQRLLWPQQTGRNPYALSPWHPDLDRVMFYL